MHKPLPENRYKVLIERVFFAHFDGSLSSFEFVRSEIEDHATQLGIVLPKNVGDILYAFRTRIPLPEKILVTQPEGKEWIIEGAGRGKYRFKLVPNTRIVPNPALAVTGIPDATPEIIRAYALDDEQALLAIVRYNRLIDTFLGITTYSLQNHLRTTVAAIGQIEIDELYIGVDKRGCHYAIPVQAKGGKDQIGVVQTTQDIRFVEERFPDIRCRAISVQFMSGSVVAMFELALQDDELRIVEERHYRLIPASEIEYGAIRRYND